MNEVQYYKRADDDGTIVTLARIREANGGLYGEIYANGKWHEWPAVFRFLSDPLEAAPISQDEAEQIRRLFDIEDAERSRRANC